jgi:hypothetical protein
MEQNPYSELSSHLAVLEVIWLFWNIKGIKAFNHLPQALKGLTSDVPNFKRALERFLLHHSFYSMREYYQ